MIATTERTNKTYHQTRPHWPAPTLIMSSVRVAPHVSGFPSRILVPWDELLVDASIHLIDHLWALEFVVLPASMGVNWTEADE